MPNRSCLTCIHSTDGLCEQCQADYDEDPDAWIEYGPHPAGIARWAAEQAMQAEWCRQHPASTEPLKPDPEIPFCRATSSTVDAAGVAALLAVLRAAGF
jgi:hypothetical protein